jgi:predicted enzyme related to lactoylglutathione lyase
MIGPIKTVAVYVEDQQAAKRFYTEALGFTVRKEMPMGPSAVWIEVSPPGAETAIVLYPRGMMTNWAEMKPSIVFHCDDVEGTIRELTGRGVRVIDQPNRMQWGTYAKIADLDGNEFLLVTPAG